jgi:hypothetical protein
MGSVMKSDIVSHLADEQYVVRVEGRVSRTIAVFTMRLERGTAWQTYSGVPVRCWHRRMAGMA